MVVRLNSSLGILGDSRVDWGGAFRDISSSLLLSISSVSSLSYLFWSLIESQGIENFLLFVICKEVSFLKLKSF